MEEFSPTPAETERLLAADYGVARNLVVGLSLSSSLPPSLPPSLPLSLSRSRS